MKIFAKKVRMPKHAIWLVPGLKVKRWFLMSVTGSVLAAIGVTFMFKLEPLSYILNLAKTIFATVRPEPVGALFIFVGAILFIQSWRKTNISMLDSDNIDLNRKKKSMGE